MLYLPYCLHSIESIDYVKAVEVSLNLKSSRFNLISKSSRRSSLHILWPQRSLRPCRLATVIEQFTLRLRTVRFESKDKTNPICERQISVCIGVAYGHCARSMSIFFNVRCFLQSKWTRSNLSKEPSVLKGQ